MTQVFNNLTDACLAVGVHAPTIQRRGAWIPCPLLGKGAGNDTGRVLFFFDGKGGIVHNWQTNRRAFFFYTGLGALEKDRAQTKAKIKAEQAKIRAAIESRHELAAKRAKQVYAFCDKPTMDNGDYKYLKNKGLSPLPFPVVDSEILANCLHYHPKGSKGEQLSGKVMVFPVTDVAGNVWSLQFIDDHGVKAMLAGGAMSGRMISRYRPIDFSGFCRVGIAEGVATACSVERLFRIPCVAAICCSNLRPVALKLQQEYPWLLIEIYGDVGRGSNDAQMAACAVSGNCFFPEFKKIPAEVYDSFVEEHGTPTDFNDWEQLNEKANSQSLL